MKSYCLRNNLGEERIKKPKPALHAGSTKRKREPRPLIDFCRDCGGAFIQNQTGAKKMYCSKLCANRYHLNNPRTFIPRLCEVCGTLIKERDHTKKRKYCSQECYRTARYYADGSARQTKSICLICVKEMIEPGHKKRKYCSRECYYDSLVLKQKGKKI